MANPFGRFLFKTVTVRISLYDSKSKVTAVASYRVRRRRLFGPANESTELQETQ